MTTTAPHGGMLRTKSVDDVLKDSEGGDSKLKKRLGLFDLIGFGVGLVIGTGIFTLTGVQAKNNAGPGIVISFVIAGIVALLAAVCYAELASAVPTAGSAYSYAYATIGEVVAWIIGWDLLLEFVLGSAVVARGWSGYLQELFDLPTSIFGEKSVFNVGAVFIVAVLAVVAIVGVKESARVTNVLVVVKVAICLFVIVVGVFFIKKSNLTPFVPPAGPPPKDQGLKEPVLSAIFGAPSSFGVAGVIAAGAIVFFAYTGFESVANLSEESKKPARDLPRGLIGTLILATVLYAGVAFVVTGMQKYTDLSEGAPLAGAFDAVDLSWAGSIVSVAAVCGLTSVILVQLVTLARIGFAMGRDKLLPQSIAGVNEKTGTPVRFTIVVAVAIMLISGFVPLADLADLVSIGALTAFAMVSVAVPLLRRTKPDLERPFRVPFSPVIPILSAAACVYLSLNLSIETWIRFGVWLALGMAIYFGYGYRNARLAHRD